MQSGDAVEAPLGVVSFGILQGFEIDFAFSLAISTAGLFGAEQDPPERRHIVQAPIALSGR